MTTGAISDYPYALAFGPSGILASRFTSFGEFEVSRYAAGRSYHSYYKDAVKNHGQRIVQYGEWYIRDGQDLVPAPPDTHNETSTASIFRESILQANRDLSKGPGKDPSYSTLVMASAFNDSSTRIAADIVFQNGIESDQDGPKKIGNPASAASFAYGLNRCRNLARTVAECANEDEVTNLVFFVEFQQDYLYLSLSEVFSEYFTFPSILDEFASLLGEHGNQDTKGLIGTTEYGQRLQAHFKYFVKKALTSRYTKYDRNDIRAIVLAGEASPAALTSIRKIASEAVGNGKFRVFDSINPSEVVARGAAKYAKLTVQRPELWGFHAHNGGSNSHDEL